MITRQQIQIPTQQEHRLESVLYDVSIELFTQLVEIIFYELQNAEGVGNSFLEKTFLYAPHFKD